MTERSARIWIRFMAAALVIIGLEAFSYTALWLIPRATPLRPRTTRAIRGEQSFQLAEYLSRIANAREQIDPELGWRYRAGHARFGDRINSQGLRAEREYSPMPADGVTRVAAFGDSFVYGTEVSTGEVWTAVIEREYPQIEVLNYGVGAYGNDQAYLRFVHEGTRLAPSVVILGFAPVDLQRLTNVFRKFLDDREFPWTKPRFVRSADTLALQPPPIADSAGYAALLRDPYRAVALDANDQWFEAAIYRNPLYDYSATIRLFTFLGVRAYNAVIDPDRLLVGDEFNPASEAFALQLAITDRFVRDAGRSGQKPFMVVFPDERSIRQSMDGKRTVYAGLVDSLRARGVAVIDPLSEFVRLAGNTEVAAWFEPGGHYSAAGNAIVARVVAGAILTGSRPDPESLVRGAIAVDKAAARGYANQADVAIEDGRIADARALLERAVQLDPKDRTIRGRFGHVLLELGETEAAIRHLQLAPRTSASVEPTVDLGRAYLAVERTADAVGAFRKALELRPDRIDVAQFLGALLIENAQFGDAIEVLETAARIAPDVSLTFGALALAYAAVGRGNEAIRSAARVAAHPGADDGALLFAGRAMIVLGRLAEADTLLGRAVRMNPESVESLTALGLTRALQGSRQQATELYQRALRLSPDYAPARDGLEALRRP